MEKSFWHFRKSRFVHPYYLQEFGFFKETCVRPPKMKKKLLVFSKKIVLPSVHKILTQRTWIIFKKSSSPVKDKRKDLNIACPSVHPSVHEIIYRFSRAKSEALVNYILTKKKTTIKRRWQKQRQQNQWI